MRENHATKAEQWIKSRMSDLCVLRTQQQRRSGWCRIAPAAKERAEEVAKGEDEERSETRAKSRIRIRGAQVRNDKVDS